MNGSIVQNAPAVTSLPQQRLDPLSEVLSLICPQTIAAGGFTVTGDLAIHFPKHQGIKCYSVFSGSCFVVMEGEPAPIALHAGDCFLLPRGIPFTLTTDLSLEPVLYTLALERGALRHESPGTTPGGTYMAGGFFAFPGGPAQMILQSLPPIVHLRNEADKAAMRSSMERMREELANARPGAALIAQHLAHTMLIQALRLHLADTANGSGWLFALSDPQLSRSIAAIHETPAAPWTVASLAECAGMSRSLFASRFQAKVGTSPVEYVTRWRMLLAADRLRHSRDGLSAIAGSLGYESESAFGKAFRRVMGASPRQFARG